MCWHCLALLPSDFAHSGEASCHALSRPMERPTPGGQEGSLRQVAGEELNPAGSHMSLKGISAQQVLEVTAVPADILTALAGPKTQSQRHWPRCIWIPSPQKL